MAPNQPSLPRRWLMTDERIGDRLWQAIEQLPVGDGGIVFRHHDLPKEDRLELGRKVAAAARKRQLMLAVARSDDLARELMADLLHNPKGASDLPVSSSVHDERDAAVAAARRVAMAFVSPIFPTRSHPDRPALGLARAAELALLADCPAIALGGMDEERFAELTDACPGRFHGFAGIDCWLGERPRT